MRKAACVCGGSGTCAVCKGGGCSDCSELHPGGYCDCCDGIGAMYIERKSMDPGLLDGSQPLDP